MTELAFVLAPGQNHFFFELAEVLAAELRGVGMEASVGTSGFPEPRDDLVYALLPPHEYFVLEGAASPPPPELLRRTVFISAEQPETVHFRQNLALGARAGALFDINARAVRVYRRWGLPARHLRLGYTPAWDHFDAAGDRGTGVLFLGALTPRRARILAAAAEPLGAARSRIVLSDNSRPNPAGSPSFLAGEEKWAALRGARTLLNVHQGDEPYFEWHRALQAIHCGAAVVTEPSTDSAPLVPGVHMHQAPAGDVARASAELATRPEDAATLAKAAYEFLREELPLRRSVEALAGAADDLRGGGRASGIRARVAARTAAARLRVARPRRVRGEPAQGGAPAGAAVIEADEAGVLLRSPQCRLLPAGVEALRAAMDRMPEAAYAFGLVAAGTTILNPFGWREGLAPTPPILVQNEYFERARAAAGDGASAAALCTAVAAEGGAGVNCQTFVARQGGVPNAVGDALGG